jgi:hypothetical protein
MKSLEEVKSMINDLQKIEEKLLKEMDCLEGKNLTSEQDRKFTKLQNEIKELDSRINTLEWVWGSNKMGGNYSV